MKFCDLRCTSHLRKKSYTVFVIRSNEDGCNQDHEKEKVFKVSEPAGNMSLWIRACVETFDALLIVDPKR